MSGKAASFKGMCRLRVGQRLRLVPDGMVYEVTRVTDCAAHIVGRGEPRTVTVPDGKGGMRQFEAAERWRLEISPYSFVYDLGESE